jgi:hypothetical protein
MRVNPKKDVMRSATGETVPVPTTNTVVSEKKFSLSNTTDKMGITTAGSIAKGFIWGLVIGAGTLLAIGMWKDKINISYNK